MMWGRYERIGLSGFGNGQETAALMTYRRCRDCQFSVISKYGGGPLRIRVPILSDKFWHANRYEK